MMGPRRDAQASLFYEFSIEDHVPIDHLLRKIDRHLELSEIRGFLAPYYSQEGASFDRARTYDPDALARLCDGYSI